MSDTSLAPATEIEETATETVEATVEPSEDDLLSEAFDKASDDEADEDAPEPEADEAEEEEPDGEDEAPADDIPTDISSKFKPYWKDIPEEARDLLIMQIRDQAAKTAQMGKEYSGIKPIRDTLVQLGEEMPSLMGLTPAQIADEMRTLAQINQSFSSNPAQAVMGLIQQHGLAPAVAQMLNGQQPGNESALQQEIAHLKGELQRVADPQTQRDTFDSWQEERAVLSEVEEFSATVDHWDAVQPHLPIVIEMVQQKNPNAPAKDVLREAYRIAEREFVNGGETERKAAPAAEPAGSRAESARKAASINVNGSGGGKARTLTEDEALSAAFDKAARA